MVVGCIANSLLGILRGTLGSSVAALNVVSGSDASARTVPGMPLVSGAFGLVCGGLTGLLADELFIKPKRKETEDYITGRFG